LQAWNAGDREETGISVTMRTPGNDFELCLGFLFTEGIIRDTGDVVSIRYCNDRGKADEAENIVKLKLREGLIPDIGRLKRNFYTTSGCGVCGKTSIEAVKSISANPVATSNFSISLSTLLTLPDKLRKSQNVFDYTGGLHASALFDETGNVVLIREDIGRHNALDKVIGAAMGKSILPLSRYLLLLSGRASFDLVQKAAMAGIPVVASVGVPSNLAVQMAKETGISLVGFLRGNRCNVYTGNHRIHS
ncbi:MAG: formate dehydrogenase accessory sulfurtransferase FdhD, partial [Bacteroidia bacterium]|nr:formate dehydrogenase accessory sulfurtransferase FdhD [Bacteroidia bacterium]